MPSLTPIPEETAVMALDERLRAGDRQALDELCTLCRPRLARIAAFRLDERLRPRLDPDDVVQETYLAAEKRLGSYATGPYTTPFLWLRAILNQTLVDLHREHVGARMRSPDREVRADAPVGHETTSALVGQLAGNATSPGEAAAHRDMLAMLRTAIAGMDPVDREVLALRHFEELANREVAAVLGIEQKAASIRYIRALRRLRDLLAQMSAYFQQPPG